MSNTLNTQDPSRSHPPAAPSAGTPDQPVQYDSAKGCLIFIVLGAVLLGIVIAAVVMFGQPA